MATGPNPSIRRTAWAGCFAFGPSSRRSAPSCVAALSVLTGLISFAALAQSDQPSLIVGRAVWPGHDLTKAKVELFADAKWTHRAAVSREVGQQGTYAVAVAPGRYFARLWVDENDNGKLDAGDGIGYHGIRKPDDLGREPKAIVVERGRVATDVGIAVVATIGPDGKPQPLGPGGEKLPSVLVAGKVVWQNRPLAGARVDLFHDERLRDLAYSSPPVEEGGSFALLVAPGRYYARVIVDVNGNHKLDAGDGLGFYGVEDMTDPEDRPVPLVVEPDEFALKLKIPVCATIREDGRLAALETPATLGSTSAKARGTIRGRILSPGNMPRRAWVLCASPRPWLRPLGAARSNPTTGEFQASVAAGKCVVLAFIDRNDNARLDTGDLVGVLGIDSFGDASAQPTVMELGENETVEGLAVAVVGRIIDGGNIVPIEGEIPDKLPDVNVEPSEVPAIVEGRVTWAGRDVPGGSVNVFRDPAFLDHVATVPCEPDPAGRFVVALPAGDYYLMAGVDADGDARVSPGDGIGIYGSEGLLGGKEKHPLRVENGAFVTDVEIHISAAFGANLVPEPTEAPTRPPGPGR